MTILGLPSLTACASSAASSGCRRRSGRHRGVSIHDGAHHDDPCAYTATWTSGFSLRLGTGDELFEYVCQDNNHGPELMVGSGNSVDRSSPIVP